MHTWIECPTISIIKATIKSQPLRSNSHMLFLPRVVKKWLYILKLNNGKYYVGITDDLSDRLN